MNNIVIKKCLKDKKNYINILVIILSIFLITIAFSFYKMCSSYYKETSLSLNYRSLYVYKSEPDWSVYDEENLKLKGIDHVVDYYYNNEFHEGVYIKTNENDAHRSVIVRGIGNQVNINLVEGVRDISDNEIICPSIFSMSSLDELVEDNTLIIKYELGDILHGYVKQYDTYMNLINNKDIDLKIVGTYTDHNLDSGFDVCYGTHELVYKIYNARVEYEKDFTSENSVIGIIVDDAKNINDVVNKLEKMGYVLEQGITFDSSVMAFLYSIVALVIIIVSIVTIIINTAIYNKNREYYKSEGLVYKTFGYSTNDVVNIYTKQLIFIVISGSFISLILVALIQFIINCMLNNNPFVFYGMPISVSIFGYIFGILINAMIILVLRKKYSNYMNEASIILELKKNE